MAKKQTAVSRKTIKHSGKEFRTGTRFVRGEGPLSERDFDRLVGKQALVVEDGIQDASGSSDRDDDNRQPSELDTLVERPAREVIAELKNLDDAQLIELEALEQGRGQVRSTVVDAINNERDERIEE